MRQIQIDFEAGLTQQFPAFIDVLRHCVYACGKPLKTVAADMDLSQTELSRQLADNPNDPRYLKAEDIPALIAACGPKGHDVVYWLVAKFLEDPALRHDRALEALQDMVPRLRALMEELNPDGTRDEPAGPAAIRSAWRLR